MAVVLKEYVNRIVLIGDSFPPLQNSCAIQLRDLSREFCRQGYDLTVMVPSPDLENFCLIEQVDGVRVVYLKSPQIKGINFFRRSINEFLLPFYMYQNLMRSTLAKEKWDCVVWYSPSIFHGPLVKKLKKFSNKNSKRFHGCYLSKG